MRTSPVAVGLVLGLVVGAAGAAAIAATGSSGEASKPKIVIAGPSAPAADAGAAAALPGGGPMVGVEIKVQGTLPELAGDARGYRLGSEPAAGSVQRLAEALGVHGSVQADAGGWVVREGNRLVRVQRAPGLPWFLSIYDGTCTVVPGTAGGSSPGPQSVPPAPPNSASDNSSSAEALPPVAPPGPTDCPETAGGGSVSSGVAVACPLGAPPESCPSPGPPPRPADLPTQDEALAVGMETLGRGGLGVSKPVITDQSSAWRIEASPLVDNQPTSGFAWTVTIGPKRAVTEASGFLAKPEPAESYPLVGTAKGLERLKASTPVPMLGMPQCSPESPACPPPRSLVRTVTGVKLGLMVGQVQRDGPGGAGVPYLVPAYLFELEGQPPPVAPVPAVQDRWLEQSPVLVPGPKPMPAPAPVDPAQPRRQAPVPG